MSFTKPSTQTAVVGAYSYKGILPSPPQNYIDNQFPNCLDKTNGDTITGTITLSGDMTVSNGTTITFAPVSILDILSGSFIICGGTLSVGGTGSLTVGSGAPTNINGSFSIGSDSIQFTDVGNPITIFQDAASITAGQNLNIEAQNTVASASSGGNLILKSGNGSGSGGSGGNVEIIAGTGSVVSGEVTMSGSGLVLSLPTIAFDSVQPTPIISQELLSSGAATSLTVEAQSTLSGAGGTLFLYSGSGSTKNGSVSLGDSVVNLFTVGTAGLQLYTTSIALTTGTVTLSAAQYRYPFIQFTGSLSGDVHIIFPALSLPAVWFVSVFTMTAFGGHSIDFTCGSVTSNLVLTAGAIGSMGAVITVDAANNIGATLLE